MDADLKGAFDNSNHEALLKKLNTYPAIRRAIKAWLKAGVMDDGVCEETTRGTPQGGVASPLLMNIAWHGMETALLNAYPTKADRPQFVRYADDLVVFHPTEEGVKKAREVLETWLADMGLELKPSKTRIAHTLDIYQGQAGFDFLGFTVRQFPVGKTHTGKLLNKRKGKCRWCELLFQDGDMVEIDHIIPRSRGGGEEISNKWVFHRHCHDQRHAQRVNGTYDKGHTIEELDDAKVSCPVLQTSESGDTPA